MVRCISINRQVAGKRALKKKKEKGGKRGEPYIS